MSEENPQIQLSANWKLEKFEVDPATGAQVLVEVIEGGDDLPTVTTYTKETS